MNDSTQDETYKKQLLEMAEADQGLYEETVDSQDVFDEDLAEAHKKALKRIVADIGWPTEEHVGPEASVAAWLIVQHADHDPAFQEEMLAEMKSLPEGAIEGWQIAFLEDRIRVNEERPQLYGTQFFRDEDGTVHAFPIEQREQLADRRTQMGLEPFEAHLDQMQSLSDT